MCMSLHKVVAGFGVIGAARFSRHTFAFILQHYNKFHFIMHVEFWTNNL